MKSECNERLEAGVEELGNNNAPEAGGADTKNAPSVEMAEIPQVATAGGVIIC